MTQWTKIKKIHLNQVKKKWERIPFAFAPCTSWSTKINRITDGYISYVNKMPFSTPADSRWLSKSHTNVKYIVVVWMGIYLFGIKIDFPIRLIQFCIQLLLIVQSDAPFTWAFLCSFFVCFRSTAKSIFKIQYRFFSEIET